MSRRRTPAQEMAAWKRRIAVILTREAKCPACANAAREAEGTTLPKICGPHKRIRRDAACEGMKKWS